MRTIKSIATALTDEGSNEGLVSARDLKRLARAYLAVEPLFQAPVPTNDILVRLRGYNPPDRTIDEQRQIAVDIQDAIAEIERLRCGWSGASHQTDI